MWKVSLIILKSNSNKRANKSKHLKLVYVSTHRIHIGRTSSDIAQFHAYDKKTSKKKESWIIENFEMINPTHEY